MSIDKVHWLAKKFQATISISLIAILKLKNYLEDRQKVYVFGVGRMGMSPSSRDKGLEADT